MFKFLQKKCPRTGQLYALRRSLYLIAALCVPWATQAQTLTVADGTATNTYVPIYGFYCDDEQHNQVLYPSTMLTGMAQSYITSVTFYQSQVAAASWGTTVTIKLMETTATSLSDLVPSTGATTVWTGSVSGTTSPLTFTFTTPFAYQGGNLLVDITTTASTYSQNYWYGIASGTSVWSYGDGYVPTSINSADDGDVETFTPKATFAYNASGNICFAPTNFAATVTGSDVDFSWTAGDGDSWQIVWGTGSFNPDTVTVNIDYPTTPTYSLTGLDDGAYTAYIRTDCGTDSSIWTSVDFNIGIIIMNMATSGDDTIYTCNAIIYDCGGPTGVYTSNDNSYLTVYPADADHILKLWGYSYTESSYDYLRITDLTTGEVLFQDNATPNGQTIDTIIAYGGVELYFQSDVSVTYDGFDVHVACLDAPSCMSVMSLALDHVTPDSLVLTWTDTVNSGASYYVEYREHGSNGEWNALIVNDTVVAIDQLQANTLYDIIVRAVCGGGDSSFAATRTYRTACSYISQLPYSNDFENEPYYLSGTTTYAEAFPSCWTRINDASGTYNYYPYISSTASYCHSGTKGMYWYHSTTTTYADNEYAILPPIDLSVYDISDLTLAFYAKTTGASYHPQPIVGVMTNPTDTTTFVPVRSFSATEITTSWQMFDVSLANYSGSGAYIAIKWPRTSSTCYLAIDDIYLTDEWCNMPANVIATSSADEITVSWDPQGGTSFEVVLGEDTISGVTDTFYTFTNLIANTEYHYAVSNECTDGNSMYVGGDIRTLCVMLDSLPYSYGFEDLATGSSSVRPVIPCWHHLNNGTSYFGYPYASSTSPHGGTRNLYWYASTTQGTYGDYQIVVLPGVDTTLYPINTLRLSFWARSSSTSYYPVFHVGVMTDPNDPSTFQSYDTISVGNNTSFQKFTTIFGNFTGEGQFVAVRAVRPSSSWYAYTDDFTLDLAPSCPPVDSHTALTTVSAALIDWTLDPNFASTPESFEVSYGYAADNLAGATTVIQSETSILLTGLDADTSYKMSVTPICDGEPGNPYIINFSTKALPCVEWDTTGNAAAGPADTIVVGNPGTSTTDVMPLNQSYNYSYCQFIVLASEVAFNGPATISGIAFDYSGTVNMTHATACSLYVANTTRNSMATGDPFVPSNQLQLVYVGPMNCSTTGWNYFQFNQGTLQYDGTSNLVVAIVDNSGSSDGSGATFRYQQISGTALTHRVYGSTPYDQAAMDAATANASFWRSNMRFVTGGGGDCIAQATCAAPAVMMEPDTNGDLQLTWIPGYQETSWNVDYRPENATSWTNAVTATTSTSYTLQTAGWLANTNYTIRVSSICTDTTLSATVNYKTPCGPTPVPFSEDFDTWSSTAADPLPDCWDKHTNYTSNYPYASTSQHHSGTKSMYMYSTATTYSYMVLPEFDLPIDSTMVSFWLYSGSLSYILKVGVMTDPADVNTFVEVATVTPTATSSWDEYEVSFASYTGTGNRIAIMSPNGTLSYPYLDDLTVNRISDCPHVNDLHATEVLLDSITVVWSDTVNTSWYVEYDTVDFTPGSGLVTPVAVTDTFYTLTGLDSGTVYYIYVYPDCGNTVTERHISVATLAASPATVPYSCNFEAAGVNGWDLINGNQHNYWVVGSDVNNGGNQSLYITDNGTANNYSGSASYVFATRVFNLAAGNYICSYDWKGQGESSFDFLRVALVPAATTLQAGEYSGFDNASAVPAGAIALDGAYRMNLQSIWTTHNEEFTLATAGTYKLVFLWRNDGSVYNQPPAAIDNVVLMLNTCPIPTDVDMTDNGANYVTVDWTDAATSTPQGWEVRYSDNDNNVNTIYSTSHPVTISNLSALTAYSVSVRAICGAGDTSAWSPATVCSTNMCDNATEVLVGDTNMSTTTNYYVPVNNYFRYTLTEIIIDSAEVAEIGEINAVSFYYEYSSPSTDKNDVDIYLMHTDDSVFASTADLHIIDTSATADNPAVLVYSGPLNCVQGWNLFGFSTPFTWDGHSNIIVVIDDNSNDYNGTSYIFRARNCNGDKTLNWYSDSYNPDPTNATYSGSKYLRAYRPEMKLVSCGISCPKPSILPATNVTYQSATVNWNSSATDFEVAVKAATDATWPAEVAVSNATSYAVNNLLPATQYQFRVRAICDATEGLISDWTEGVFVTDSLPCFVPTNLHTTNLGYTTATLAWNAGASQNQWSVQVWNSSTEPVDYAVSGNASYTVTGLAANTQYYAAVKAVCGGGLTESEYSDTISFTTNTCAQVTGVTVNGITAHTAVVSWTPMGVSTYKIEYGDRNFSEGNGTTVVVNNATSYTLTGLEEDFEYTVFVKAVCEEGVEGVWSEQVNFDTPEGGVSVNTVDGAMNLSIYPNPTSNATTIAVSGVNGEVSITIVDMNGRAVMSDVMSCEGDCTKRMEVSGLAQGAYFVRVSGEGLNQVRKLVIK